MVCAQVSMKTLAEFIEEKRNEDHYSIRQFADVIKVSHVTLVHYLSADPPEPSLEFLEKLALATHTDLCVLVAMVKPNATRINPRVQLIANRIAALPDDKIEFLEDYMRGVAFKPGEDAL